MTVKKASDLPAADHNGLSDPYVKMTLDEKKKKTHVQRHTLNPTWNEKHEWMHVRPFRSPLRLSHLAQLSYLLERQEAHVASQDELLTPLNRRLECLLFMTPAS